MEKSNDVKCWCCEYYWPYDEENDKHCRLKNIMVSPYDTVCADFLLNSGLYTKRTIPDCCVNYKDNKNRDERPVHLYKSTKD